MAVKLRINNPLLNSEERTYLTADYSTGTSLTVRNNEGFTTNWFAVAGEPGQEQSELRSVSGISGNTTITIGSSLRFSHPTSDPVYLSRWDRLYMYRATSENGSYSAVTNAETSNGYWDIEWDDQELCTLVIDDDGSTSSFYKWRFYNSNTGIYSQYSGVLPGSGLARNQAGFVIKKVRKNPITNGITDETMYNFMSDLNDLVYEEMPKAWWFSKEGTSASTVADTYRYSIDTNWSDFLSMEYLLYRYVSGSVDNTYPLKFVTRLEFYNYKRDANLSSDDNARVWTLLPPDSSSDKGYIAIHPTPDTTACYLKPVYFFDLSDVNSFADTLVVPKPKLYEDYILYRICDDIKHDPNAEKYNSRVKASIESLKTRVRRQQGQREMTRYRGPDAYNQLFSPYGGTSNDSYRENYW